MLTRISPKLQQWFSIASDQHKIMWAIKDYAQSWIKAVNNTDISQILNVIPSINSNNNNIRDNIIKAYE